MHTGGAVALIQSFCMQTAAGQMVENRKKVLAGEPLKVGRVVDYDAGY